MNYNEMVEEEQKYFRVKDRYIEQKDGSVTIIKQKVLRDKYKFPVVSNLDKIRSMNMEQLARFLLAFKQMEYFTPLSELDEYSNNDIYNEVLNDLVEWLKEIVK